MRGDPDSIASIQIMSLRDVYERGFDEENGKTTNADDCPECSGTLVTDGGEIRCSDCGLVVDVHRIDHGPEWTNFDESDNDPRRTGPTLTPARHDRGLSTEISFGGDANGNPLSGKKRRQIARLRHQHSRARWRSKAERNLAHAFSEIARMAAALELSKRIRDEACDIYRQAHNEDLIQGRSIETIAAGSLYAALRIRGLPWTVADIADVSNRDEQKIELGFRVLNTELGLEAQIVGVRDRIPRLAAEVEIPGRVQHDALELASLAEETGITNGRNPSGVAAACVYLAARDSGFDLTQSDLADLANVTPATLRRRYYELEEELA